MVTICAFALAAIAWSFFGRLDVHATAPGKIETDGYAKVIEPLDPGRVAAIRVDTGEPAEAGELLLEFDPSEASADALSAQDLLKASPAEVARRRYAIDALRSAQAQAPRTESNLATDMSIGFQTTLMETLNERVSTRQEAIDRSVGTKINLYDAKEELEKSEGFAIVADNENKLAEASRKVDEARQALAKGSARLARTKLYAPIDGVVQQIAVTTVDQVVTTGQQLVVITPNAGRL